MMDDSVKDSQIESILLRNETLVYKTRGVSMEPMLLQNRDLVVVRAPASRLKKYDVALYKRGETHVLHRVIAVKGDHYLIRGDNTYTLENVPDSAVIGVLSGFQRKGKKIDVENRGYRLYVRFWDAIYPLRALRFRSRRLAVGVARELGVLPLIKKLLRKET